LGERKKGNLMKLKLILILWLLFFLTFPFHLIAQPKEVGRVYKVAILPFIIHSQENLDYLREGIYDILSSRISVEGRITVIERTTVERILWEIRPIRLDEAVAKEVGSRAGADYIVLGSLTKIGSYISLDARLLSITEDKPPLGVYTQHKGLDDVMTKIGDFAQEIGYKILGRRFAVSPPSEKRSPYLIRPERGRMDREGLEFKKSQTFGFEIKGLDIGDVDGDRKNEIVVMDYHNIYVFKYDGEKLNLFRKIEAGYQHNFLTLDVADINRNGFAEIIVTSVIEDNLQSFILEYEQGEFKSITRRAGWFFRALEHPKEGPILIGQQMSSEGLLSGPIYQFLWKKKAFEKGPKMPLPKDFKIFGFTIGDIRGQGKPDIIQLDEFDYLKILTHDGKFIWKSKENFGGTLNFYETLKKKEEVYRGGEAPPWRVYIPGRILVKDLDGDGVNEVIINRNHSAGIKLLQKLRSFESGEIHNLIWDETGLTTNWKTRELNGYISDYQVKDVSNSGENELVVALVESPRSGMMEKGSSKILFFKLF
jgi:TolB-like protein